MHTYSTPEYLEKCYCSTAGIFKRQGLQTETTSKSQKKNKQTKKQKNILYKVLEI